MDCEILVVNRHGLSATASVYNTLGLNDCPEAQWKALDPEKIKKERKTYMVDQDLVVRNSGSKAYVLQDDLRDSYQRMN